MLTPIAPRVVASAAWSCRENGCNKPGEAVAGSISTSPPDSAGDVVRPLVTGVGAVLLRCVFQKMACTASYSLVWYTFLVSRNCFVTSTLLELAIAGCKLYTLAVWSGRKNTTLSCMHLQPKHLAPGFRV